MACYYEGNMAYRDPTFELQAPVQGPSPKGIPWGLGDVLLSLAILVVIAILVMSPAIAVAAAIAKDADNLMDDPEALAIVLGANLLLEAALIGVAILFSVARYRTSFAALGFRRPEKGGFWLPIAVLFAAYLIIGVYFSIIAAIGVEALEPQSTVPDTAFDSPIVLPIAAVLVLVFAPLMEETFFRGFVFGALRVRWGLLPAALASGFLFSALHFDVGSLLPFAAIGALFAWSYAYSGSVFASMAAHFLFNGIGFLATLSGGST
jgi:membrane protease YdiL (CAAX protease family)